MNWELVGHFSVDAGLCWIGDPCYCVTPDCTEHPAQTWHEFCDKLIDTDFDKKGSMSFNFPKGHGGLGILVSTGYGDGSYPVYIRKNDEGRVIEVRIKFDEEEGENDDL